MSETRETISAPGGALYPGLEQQAVGGIGLGCSSATDHARTYTRFSTMRISGATRGARGTHASSPGSKHRRF